MAKKKAPLAAPQAQTLQPNMNPLGPSELRQVVKSDEQWSEFTLNDGTKLRVKPLLTFP
jgi:hypothetical protein